jgi:signal transduction histidine kinase
MGSLIDDLLRLSRAGRVEMRPEPVDLATLAQTIVAELRQRQAGRKVDFFCNGPLPAVADRALIRILLENLLDNAWKYTRKEPAAQVALAAAPGTAGAKESVFVVTDNGAGFDMRFVDKLFAPFQRLHPVSDFEGTGIGLATVRRIAARHGGRVWAESQPGAGAAFYFTLSAGTR